MNLLVIGIGHEKDLIIGYRFKFFISCIPNCSMTKPCRFCSLFTALVFVETESENATRHDHSQSEDPSRLTLLWGGTFSQCDTWDIETMLNKEHNKMSYTVTPGQNKQTD